MEFAATIERGVGSRVTGPGCHSVRSSGSHGDSNSRYEKVTPLPSIVRVKSRIRYIFADAQAKDNQNAIPRLLLQKLSKGGGGGGGGWEGPAVKPDRKRGYKKVLTQHCIEGPNVRREKGRGQRIKLGRASPLSPRKRHPLRKGQH